MIPKPELIADRKEKRGVMIAKDLLGYGGRKVNTQLQKRCKRPKSTVVRL